MLDMTTLIEQVALVKFDCPHMTPIGLQVGNLHENICDLDFGESDQQIAIALVARVLQKTFDKSFAIREEHRAMARRRLLDAIALACGQPVSTRTQLESALRTLDGIVLPEIVAEHVGEGLALGIAQVSDALDGLYAGPLWSNPDAYSTLVRMNICVASSCRDLVTVEWLESTGDADAE